MCKLYQRQGILDAYLPKIKYNMAYEKHIDFMKKHVTASETSICGSYFLSNSWQETIQNNLNPTNTLFKNNDFKSKKLLGEKWTVIEI